MTCTMLVPTEGLMEVWNYDRSAQAVLAELGLSEGVVRINLTVDNLDIGIAAFSVVADLPANARAQTAIHYLIGAHLAVSGPLVLQDLNEGVAIEIMQELAG